MPTIDETKPAGKSGKRKSEGKAERKKKPASQKQSPAPVILRNPEPVETRAAVEDLHPAQEPMTAVAAQPAVAEPVELAANPPEPAPVTAPSLPEPVAQALAPVEAAPSEPAPPAEPVTASPPPAEPAPVNMQTIANAYRDYTRKSFEAFGSYVEQLSSARSLDKAITAQREFMKRTYETSVSETQRICELHARLARQNLDPFTGLSRKAPDTQRKP